MNPEEIKARRAAAGMSPEELAVALDVSVRTISRLESGEYPASRAQQIALDVIFSEQVGAKSVTPPARKSLKR